MSTSKTKRPKKPAKATRREIEDLQLDREVVWFAAMMQARLDANAHKGDYRTFRDIPEIMKRLMNEIGEVVELVTIHAAAGDLRAALRIGTESADVGNFLLMLWLATREE